MLLFLLFVIVLSLVKASRSVVAKLEEAAANWKAFFLEATPQQRGGPLLLLLNTFAMEQGKRRRNGNKNTKPLLLRYLRDAATTDNTSESSMEEDRGAKDLDEERHLQAYTRRAHSERSISRDTGETTYIQRRKETGATERNYYDYYYYYCQLRRTGAAAAMQDPPRKKQQQRRRRIRDRQIDKE